MQSLFAVAQRSPRFSRASGGFAYPKAYALRLPHSADSCINLLRHSEDQTYTSRYWNINQLCIDYSLRPHLSSRLTLGGRTFPRKPYPYGEQDFNLFYRYSCLHSHFLTVQGRLPLPLRSVRNAFLPNSIATESMTSVRTLSPDHFRRRSTR